ncbi:MAG: cupredoxin domain-containing protein [Ignavibacteriae bacterium]|nr:cupredoxin domain-containing protein [Ignavibacteriota bacterium]
MRMYILALACVLTCIAATEMPAQCSMKGGHKHGSGPSGRSHSAVADPSDQVVATMQPDNIQSASIVVKGGYSPSTIIVRKGVPVQLHFDLREKSCTGTVVFPELDITRELTPFAITTIEFTPAATGSFTFACPMNMIQGTLIVKSADTAAPLN